jgi:hypothetical protein
MTFTARDLRDQIIRATDASDGDYDVDAITEDITAKYGAVDIDTIDTDDFWAIVAEHAAETADDSTYTAEISISSKVALGDKCAVTVVNNDDVRQGMESTDTALPIDGDHPREEVYAAAETVLTANGWTITGDWQDSDNSYYVTVKRA